MRILVSRVLLIATAILIPATVFAQASIAGSVRDASGAAMPGVTVEAGASSSSARRLISEPCNSECRMQTLIACRFRIVRLAF
jgi:hypothetical protein